MTNSPSDLWSEVLNTLRSSMTRATFDTHLKDTTATQQNGTLVISAPSAYALDWLENRLRHSIERAVAGVAGRELEVKFQVASGELAGYQPDLFFTGTYRDAYNEIVKPNRQHYTSKYFHEKWLPILGPDLWLLIWELRTRCDWDWKIQEIRRDTVETTCEELARAIGLSERTVWRLLYPKDPKKKALLAQFVTKCEVKRGYSKKVGRVVNESTKWRIRLDDPLTPDDEMRLQQMIPST